MLRKSIFITFFLLAVMTFAPLQGQCENWKQYFQDSNRTYYYDKDSIHYPKTKKNLIGVTVKDKNIVNVWVRKVSKEDGKTDDATIEQIYCIERECAGHRGCGANPNNVFDINNWHDPLANVKEVSRKRAPIEPGSMYEILLKKVCP